MTSGVVPKLVPSKRENTPESPNPGADRMEVIADLLGDLPEAELLERCQAIRDAISAEMHGQQADKTPDSGDTN